MVNMNPCLREELEYRRFVDSWQVLPRRHEKHFCWSLSTDASGSGWGCVLHLSYVDQVFRDFWTSFPRRRCWLWCKQWKGFQMNS